jgi:hypothetical protein
MFKIVIPGPSRLPPAWLQLGTVGEGQGREVFLHEPVSQFWVFGVGPR